MTTPHRSAPAPSGQAPSEEPRRARLLDAALTVFGRFGFRKTSMDEVARAAGISRQGLYLHYPTKEALFCAVVDHALGAAAEDAEQALAGEGSLEDALVGALDAWVGRFVSRIAPDVTDLHEAIERLAGARVKACEAALLERLARRLRASGLVSHYRSAGLSARDLAEHLYTTARGAKAGARTRDEVVARLRVAARALCLPLLPLAHGPR